MATIEIRRSHTLSLEELRKKVDQISGSLDAKYAVHGHWQGDEMVLEGSGMTRGVKGRIKLDTATVLVELDLPLLLRPMKGQVEESIARKLDKVLAGG
ncbi:MAG: polyhydroxyalkanoic acid system family protein [Deltaproteobacteria bacterium]|nr:polyhydroxyalkanoic acid system family protein [Deltaproteobacteria bacterium]